MLVLSQERQSPDGVQRVQPGHVPLSCTIVWDCTACAFGAGNRPVVVKIYLAPRMPKPLESASATTIAPVRTFDRVLDSCGMPHAEAD